MYRDSCMDIWWRHGIWLSEKLKFDYLKERKSFHSVLIYNLSRMTRYFSLIFLIFMLHFCFLCKVQVSHHRYILTKSCFFAELLSNKAISLKIRKNKKFDLTKNEVFVITKIIFDVWIAKNFLNNNRKILITDFENRSSHFFSCLIKKIVKMIGFNL